MKKFYSDLTEKVYDKEEDLEAAEEAYTKAISAKNQKSEEKKKDAQKVEDAIKNADEARSRSTKNKIEAYKRYLNDCEKEDKNLEEAEKKKNECIKEFCKKYPEGFHSTIKYDDGSTKTYSYTLKQNKIPSSNLFDMIFRL